MPIIIIYINIHINTPIIYLAIKNLLSFSKDRIKSYSLVALHYVAFDGVDGSISCLQYDALTQHKALRHYVNHPLISVHIIIMNSYIGLYGIYQFNFVINVPSQSCLCVFLV